MAVTTVAAERQDAPTAVALVLPVAVPALQAVRVAVPCAARPGTALRHLDGPCRCFVGGPAPEFAPSGGRPTA